jgi:hypothetical protein
MSRSSAVLALGLLQRDSYIRLQNRRQKKCSLEELAKSNEKLRLRAVNRRMVAGRCSVIRPNVGSDNA